MTVRTTIVALVLLMSYGISHGKEDRWSNFAEDSDLKYYLDQKTILPVTDAVYIFWVKSVAKDKEYFKREYKIADLSYVLTNYELDCTVASYRIRGSIMFDKNRRELGKSAGDETLRYEPVPPESMLELAQEELCGKEESAELPDEEEPVAAAPLVVTVPLESAATPAEAPAAAPAAAQAEAEDLAEGELPSLQ